MVQPPDYYILMAMQAQPRRYQHDAPQRPERESIRSRIRMFLTRTTLGPVPADHALGEAQRRALENCSPAR